MFTDTINRYVKEESEKLSVFQQGGVYLATKKIGKNNPKAEEIKVDNAARQEWNRTVDVALVEGVSEEDILKIKQEKITDETLQSIRTYGWLPDMFRQIIRGAKDFLQEVIFKFKLPPRPVPKIDLQEWKDMQKIMHELQGQSREIKRIQQDISSLKKQLSELRGLFKGKERKSLEGKIELLEDLEKRLHKSMEQIVKRESYPNVQSFQKVYNKAEELIMEYNEELRAWKNQTEQKQENPLEQPKKQAYWKNCTSISRKADGNRNSQLRRNLRIENDKVEATMKKTIFEEIGGTYIRHGDYLIPCLILLEEEQKLLGRRNGVPNNRIKEEQMFYKNTCNCSDK